MKYGLIGHKIAYSLSPVIHKMINDAGIDYDIVDISPGELKEKLRELMRGYTGFNVTIPHKQSIMELCDEIDPLAAKIGAVNTVQISDAYWKGYNTDYLGFLQTVKRNIPDYFSFHPVIVGYGGVARAVIFGLQELGYVACSVTGGIDKEELNDFINEMNTSLDMKVLSQIPDMKTLWINCTPIGGEKFPDVPEDFIPFKKDDMLYDLNYAPYPTHLENEAKKQGLGTINGIHMLVSQAIEAEKIWNKSLIGLLCDADEIIRTLMEKKTYLNN